MKQTGHFGCTAALKEKKKGVIVQLRLVQCWFSSTVNIMNY